MGFALYNRLRKPPRICVHASLALLSRACEKSVGAAGLDWASCFWRSVSPRLALESLAFLD